ncbi:MAG: tetratricopeptide repeat protein [Anaeromyxobacteraceae bacterium]
MRPGDLAARVHLAELYERLGRASEAEAELRAVAAAAPQNPAPLRRLAAFYRRRGDVRGAKRAEADAARLAAPARALRPLPPSRHGPAHRRVPTAPTRPRTPAGSRRRAPRSSGGAGCRAR